MRCWHHCHQQEPGRIACSGEAAKVGHLLASTRAKAGSRERGRGGGRGAGGLELYLFRGIFDSKNRIPME